MNWEAIGSIGELLGAMGVIASLLYLSAQIRQGANAAQLATSHSIATAARQWADPMQADQDLARIFLLGTEDFDSLDERDRARFVVLCFSFFRMFEDIALANCFPATWDLWCPEPSDRSARHYSVTELE